MKRLAALWASGLALLTAASAPSARSPEGGETVELIGGRWLNDNGFTPRSAWIEKGRLTFSRPLSKTPPHRVELAGGYVVPPFCEAHNHNLGAPYGNQEMIRRYLADGIFYVQILGNIPSLTAGVRNTYGRPDSVDVAFANGGITSSDGHPIPLQEQLLETGAYPGMTRESLRDRAYFVADSKADLDRVLPLLFQSRPDFVKVFLVFSEDYEKRRNDPAFRGRKGINPT